MTDQQDPHGQPAPQDPPPAMQDPPVDPQVDPPLDQTVAPSPQGDAPAAEAPPSQAPLEAASPEPATTPTEQATPRATAVDRSGLYGVIGTVIVVVGIFIFSFLRSWSAELETLEIIAAIQPLEAAEGQTTSQMGVTGIIVYESRAVSGAEVWGVTVDENGNRYPLPRVLTDTGGDFSKPLPDVFTESNQPYLVMLNATAPAPASDNVSPPADIRGRTILRPGQTTVDSFRTRSVAPPFELLLLAFLTFTVFITSLVVALLPYVAERHRYLICLACAILLMLFMTGTLLRSMNFISSEGVPGDLFNYGFTQVFYGTHTEGVPREWMFSFTTPQSGARGGVTGFFAPLWVMLVAVVGASLMTLSLLVAEIARPTKDQSKDHIRTRIQNVVMHQFFILFAPLGAVFVYQSLLTAKAAEEPIAVATAALGAGAAINLILKRAVNATARIFIPETKERPTE